MNLIAEDMTACPGHFRISAQRRTLARSPKIFYPNAFVAGNIWRGVQSHTGSAIASIYCKD